MYYVAYGSNINLEQMAYRCPNSKVVCTGFINNYKLVYNRHANVVPCKNEKVPVLLWDINEADWRNLDMYEGYPNYYYKEVIQVEKTNGETCKAVIYLMSDFKEQSNLDIPPSFNYFNGIAEGYVSNNMDLSYLYESINGVDGYEKIYKLYKKNKAKIIKNAV